MKPNNQIPKSNKRKSIKKIKEVFNDAISEEKQIKMILKSAKPLPKSYNALCFLRNNSLLALGNNRGIEIIHFKTMKVLRHINYQVIASSTQMNQNQSLINNNQLHNNEGNEFLNQMDNGITYQDIDDIINEGFTPNYVSISLIQQLYTNTNWIGVSDYKRIKVFDYFQGVEIFEFHNSGTISVFAESKKYKALLIGNSKGQLQIGSLVDGKINHLYPKSSVLQIIITQDENYAIVCLSKDNKIIIYDLEKVMNKNYKEGVEITQFSQIISSTLLNDNKIAMIDGQSRFFIIDNNNFSQKLNLCKIFSEFADDKRSIQILYLLDNQHMAIYYKKSILIYNFNTKQIVADSTKFNKIKNFKTYAINNIAFSPKHNSIVFWAKSQQRGYLYTIQLLNYKRVNDNSNQNLQKKLCKEESKSQQELEIEEKPFKIYLQKEDKLI